MYLQSEILELSERYVKTLAKETENTLDGPFAGRITGYGKILTLKHQKTHGCVVSTVATDALVLKHQDISIHNAD